MAESIACVTEKIRVTLTLIMKSGRDPEVVYQELIDMGLTDVSMEVVGNRKEMYEEGIRLSEKFGKYATCLLYTSDAADE